LPLTTQSNDGKLSIASLETTRTQPALAICRDRLHAVRRGGASLPYRHDFPKGENLYGWPTTEHLIRVGELVHQWVLHALRRRQSPGGNRNWSCGMSPDIPDGQGTPEGIQQPLTTTRVRSPCLPRIPRFGGPATTGVRRARLRRIFASIFLRPLR